MGRSDDSDDSSHRRSKKKKSKRSKSRSRTRERKRAKSRSRSRDRRSRSRDRRSRSRDRKSRDRRSRDRRSRSRDRRSRSRDRRSKSRDRRSKSRDRRSKSREKRESKKSRKRSTSRGRGYGRTKSRSRSLPSAYKSRSPTPDLKKEEINLTIAEELKRQKQIQEIDSESFSQTSFRTDSNRVRTDYPDPQESLGFGFGTSAEVTVAAKIEAKSKLEQLNSEVLLNPDLFGDQGAVGWPSVVPSPGQPQDSDSEDEDPEEKRKRKEEEWRAEKMRKILEIAENWDARVIESARKHKSLALLIEAKEEEKQRKAELVQRKWMKADPAAPEPVPAVPKEEKYDPMEEHTWKERWLQDNKIKQVYSSSKILSKVKKKIKDQEREEKVVKAKVEEAEAEEGREKAEEPQGVIGSIQEYASLIGKSVKEMKDAQYEVPEESESEAEDEDEGEDLWGAILGGGS